MHLAIVALGPSSKAPCLAVLPGNSSSVGMWLVPASSLLSFHSVSSSLSRSLVPLGLLGATDAHWAVSLPLPLCCPLPLQL